MFSLCPPRVSGITVLIAVLSLCLFGCDRVGVNPAPRSTDVKRDASKKVESAPLAADPVRDPNRLFTEITAQLGFEENPPPYPDGTFMAPEITPGGVAVFDFDDDGRLDILQVRHPSPAPWAEQLNASEPNRLFRQKDDGRFEEVPGAGGLAGKGFHHGVAVGDVNNDGKQDVYLCNFGGPDEFFLNKGDGTFSDG